MKKKESDEFSFFFLYKFFYEKKLKKVLFMVHPTFRVIRQPCSA